jgi:5-methylcytosine-specific restriction endonuclease McrA
MNHQKIDPEKTARLRAELRKDRQIREASYREQALKLFPHACASCRREFSGKRLVELTVHHRDHDHNNNPPDGSNWELLCMYCHDNEHEKLVGPGRGGGHAVEDKSLPPVFKPFEGLDALIKPPEDQK